MSATQSDGRRDRDAYKNPPKTPPDDTLTLKVAGSEFSGWQTVRVIRGVELFPSYFQLRLTERLPGQSGLFAISPGQQCQVMIGKDLVITGFVDRYEASVSANRHEVIVTGRSATEDLVDDAAGLTSGQERQAKMSFHAATLLQLAQELCKPFGITVREPDGEGRPLVSMADALPQFTIPRNASVYDVLAPYVQDRQMLMLDGVDGNLILGRVGTVKAASGFSLPGNVLQARAAFDKVGRFTIYLPATNSYDVAYEVTNATGVGNYYTFVEDKAAFKDQPRWDGQPRYRPHFVFSELPMFDLNLAERAAKWEMGRRYGRSQTVTAVVQGWRDTGGKLWLPNTLAPVDMPMLKLPKLQWLITEVVYEKSGDRGTTTQVTLMPPEAFEPEPSFHQPFSPLVAQALQEELQQRNAPADSSPEPATPGGPRVS